MSRARYSWWSPYVTLTPSCIISQIFDDGGCFQVLGPSLLPFALESISSFSWHASSTCLGSSLDPHHKHLKIWIFLIRLDMSYPQEKAAIAYTTCPLWSRLVPFRYHARFAPLLCYAESSRELIPILYTSFFFIFQEVSSRFTESFSMRSLCFSRLTSPFVSGCVA
jgi:hypothetical protein